MTATKTNEIKPGETPGVRAKLSFVWISPYKVRQVLDLVRGKNVGEAESILRRCERDAADPVGKVLGSAVANAHVTAGLEAEELYVSACYADEGMTFKRFRYRARGRAGKIRKRTSHITVIVNRLPEDRLAQVRTRQAADLASRRKRVAGSRRRRGADSTVGEKAAAAIAAVEASTTAPPPEDTEPIGAESPRRTPEPPQAAPPSAEQEETAEVEPAPPVDRSSDQLAEEAELPTAKPEEKK